jgi:hypothetical protein
MADVRAQLLAASCPVDLADKLAKTATAAGKVGAPKVEGLFGNLQFMRKLLALWQKDGALVREVIGAITAATQAGDWMALITLATTKGSDVWVVVQDLLELFQAAPVAA